MNLDSSHCCHCGTVFGLAGKNNVYSVTSYDDKNPIEIVVGILVPDAHHYCSDECMFNREQSIIPHEYVLSLLRPNN